MRDVTPIEKLILEEEAETVGGMITLIIGEPGAGKTMALTRIVENDIEENRKPIWRGQKDCQWILLAAQGLPITFWMHESIEDYRFYLTESRKHNVTETTVNLRDKEDVDVEFKSWSEPEEVVDGVDQGRAHVTYVPGANGDEKEKYFFIKTYFELCEALVNRNYGDHVTFNADEINDVIPDLQKRPFYDLLMHQYPSVLKSMRKTNTSMRGIGHGYSEINHKFYNDKSNGIGYMQGAKVHKNHSSIDQNVVNRLNRGEIVVSGWEKGSFEMPRKPYETIKWMPKTEGVLLKMELEASIPDVRPEPEDIATVLDNLPIEAHDLNELWTPKEYAEEVGLTTRAVQKKLATNKLPGIKIGGKWLLSESQLANDEDIPF